MGTPVHAGRAGEQGVVVEVWRSFTFYHPIFQSLL